MGKNNKRKISQHRQGRHESNGGGAMSQAEIWDDSALIRSWNDALQEYEVRPINEDQKRFPLGGILSRLLVSLLPKTGGLSGDTLENTLYFPFTWRSLTAISFPQQVD